MVPNSYRKVCQVVVIKAVNLKVELFIQLVSLSGNSFLVVKDHISVNF